MRKRIWSVMILALGVNAALSVNAAEWKTRSFELRLDRLYFPAGEEALIFDNAPFAILRNHDTVYSGLIEHSWDGVSISGPSHGFFDTIPLVGLNALIASAEPDSVQTITVGSDLAGRPVRADTLGSSRLHWIEYHDAGAMREDFEAGVLDAIVSLSDLAPRPADGTMLSAPCPYLAVMVPHVGREFNFHGELATSLYYRFDNNRLALSFLGNRVTLVNRFAGSTTLSRWYDFDPARGKKLFDRISHRPSRVRLLSGHPALDGLTRYFADILSRDRCAVELTYDAQKADISLNFVPCSDSIMRITVDSLYKSMVRDTVAGSAPAEYLRRINLELRGLDIALQPADSSRRLEAVNRIMAEDLGVFPLFRPTIFIHMHKRLRNVTLAPEGQVDFTLAARVRLPEAPSGGIR